MDNARVDFEHLEWQVGPPGLRFKTAVRDGKQLRMLEIAPDVQHDWCDTGHVGYVLRGKLEIEFRDGIQRLGAGDGVFIRGGEAGRHRPKAIAAAVTLILAEEI